MTIFSNKIDIVSNIASDVIEEVIIRLNQFYETLSSAIISPNEYSQDRDQILKRRAILLRIQNPRMFSRHEVALARDHLQRHPSSLDNPASNISVDLNQVMYINEQFIEHMLKKGFGLDTNLRTGVFINDNNRYATYFNMRISMILQGFKMILSFFDSSSPTIKNVTEKLFNLVAKETHTDKQINAASLIVDGISGIIVVIDFIPSYEFVKDKKNESRLMSRRNAVIPTHF